MTKRWIALAVVLAAGCSEGEAATASSPPEPEVASEAVASEAVASEAEPSEPATETEPTEPEPTEPTPVDLLHAVPVRVRVSSAMSGNVAQIARLWDGDLTTAWNSQTDDLTGAFVEVRLPADARVESIEMTAGYTHQRGARDLFHGNHRVRRVRVVHDGVEVGRFPLDADSQELQALPVRGDGGTYRIEMLELVEGTQPTWREACISELHVIGTAPGASAGSVEPTGSIVPAAEREELARAFAAATVEGAPAEGELAADALDPSAEIAEGESDGELDDGESDGESLGEEAFEEDAAPALATDPAAGPQITEREGLHLSELTVAAGVESRQAVDPRTTYSRASDTRVYCLMRLENPDRDETTITLRWERVDNPDRGTEHEMNVAAGPRYATWGYTGTRGRPGVYRCVVRDAAGELLGSAAYELTD